ncbi:MAG: NupC/NupG family nucleoside CNT transporter [Candidatus Marinimicrobia bacterium]|nr:NupC/NupG family nucleoside CNT transporter [Candidatus Neomarinimicrobiota bacterium]MCF7829259.1 NupC/NupG family nucleoside CNT transporter [Candidatus Neomarinimicrobiota bacterium]MCF7881088.1 NupC/NupG family nucleoside CNT transporter [Candidatus Neomarinimicrobiota bacterium]
MRFVSFFGLIALMFVGYLMSNNKRIIPWRVIFWGVGLQILFATIILTKSIVSFIGLFIFFTWILFYVFISRSPEESDLLDQLKIAGLITVGSGMATALFYFLQGPGVTVWLLVAIVLWIAVNSYTKQYRFQPYAVGGLLTSTLGILIHEQIYGRVIFQALSEKVDAFLGLTDLGSAFLFGDIVSQKFQETWGFQFAFGVLPTIIFFAAFMAILYHLGIMQIIVKAMARFMRWTLGTSGAETLSCSANIFVGQTEAPLLIKPFLDKMTMSELLTIMVGGFATIAGGVLAGYIRLGVDAGHLIAASVMSAPAALVIGKIIYPETEHSDTAGEIEMPQVSDSANLLDAATSGVSDGLKLAVNVGAMLIAFIALIGFIDIILNWADKLIDGNLLNGEYLKYSSVGFSPNNGEFAGIFPGSLKTLFGTILRPIAWIMGVSWEYADEVGNLLGIKISLNEFVAFATLAEEISAEALSPRAEIIATYAICGFANFSSIGIQIGGISAIAPNRRSDLAKVGLKAMFGGALASWMTATIAGIMIA